MIPITTSCSTPNRLCHVVCAFGLLLSLAALPAFGQQIHQLSYNGSTWADQNLNGVPVEGAVSSFFTTPNHQIHVFYGANDSGDLHQLFYNGSTWDDSILTQSAGVCCGITGFSVANFQYVYYVGNDLYLHQMLYNNANWVDTNLNDATGSFIYPAGNPVAFTTSPALHVFYTGSDAHIHQTFATEGTNWQDQDLTAVTGGPNACLCVELAGFHVGNLQYVYYLDNSSHVHQLFYNNVSWSDEDLTALTKSTPASYVASMSAFVIPGTRQIRVYFASGANGHIMQLASTNNVKWSVSDLTKRVHGSPIDPQFVAFPDATGGKVNVYYVVGTDVNRIYQPTATTWANEDLTVLTNGGSADPNGQLAGFSLKNNQYLYYVAD